jgi:hypothetical protein
MLNRLAGSDDDNNRTDHRPDPGAAPAAPPQRIRAFAGRPPSLEDDGLFSEETDDACRPQTCRRLP